MKKVIIFIFLVFFNLIYSMPSYATKYRCSYQVKTQQIINGEMRESNSQCNERFQSLTELIAHVEDHSRSAHGHQRSASEEPLVERPDESREMDEERTFQYLTRQSFPLAFIPARAPAVVPPFVPAFVEEQKQQQYTPAYRPSSVFLPQVALAPLPSLPQVFDSVPPLSGRSSITPPSPIRPPSPFVVAEEQKQAQPFIPSQEQQDKLSQLFQKAQDCAYDHQCAQSEVLDLQEALVSLRELAQKKEQKHAEEVRKQEADSEKYFAQLQQYINMNLLSPENSLQPFLRQSICKTNFRQELEEKRRKTLERIQEVEGQVRAALEQAQRAEAKKQEAEMETIRYAQELKQIAESHQLLRQLQQSLQQTLRGL